MSGPHGGGDPPAILIAWSSAANAWQATAVMSADGEPISVGGPSASLGSTPTEALNELLARRFGILADQDCPATLVEIEQAKEPR